MEVGKLNGMNFWKKQNQVSELWQLHKQQEGISARLHQKLEEENLNTNKALTLDPHRNHHHHHHHHHHLHLQHQSHHQNLVFNTTHVTTQEEEEGEKQHVQHQSHTHQFQHLHHQQRQHEQQSYNTELLNPLQLPKKRSFLPPLPPPPSALTSTEHARKMGESQNHLLLHQTATPSRSTMRGGGVGEIVEVQGGHIVRSTGRKDRHSKVCTAKGPRDRRVRLAAHTAIQFYDVQDRLGYDRPSKAVDWLIKKLRRPSTSSQSSHRGTRRPRQCNRLSNRKSSSATTSLSL
ncbi:hypothetical protein ACSQ67_023836 [Phaseolus vulgaris]